MTFRFDSYEVADDGIALHFVSPDPGPGRPSDYFVTVTDAELAAAANAAQLRTLVTAKLQRKFRAAGISTKLDAFIGSTIDL
jgi:hypothetical protein